MLLNLRSVQGAHERFEQLYQPSQFQVDPESFRVISPVALRFDVDKIGEGGRYRLAGTISGTLGLTCSRCLEPFALPVEAAFDLQYLPHSENTGEGEREVAEDDLTTAYYTGEAIDLGQLMTEQFHLALPMKPLCSETCRGLCPECGTNLNLATCSCAPVWEDPRLAPLKRLIRNT